MKKNLFLGILITLTLAFIASPASAVSIGFLPSAQDIIFGSQPTVDVGVAISDLGDGVAPSLGAYDLDVTFDSAILGFDSITFGDQLDPFGLGTITGIDDSVSGVINFFEISLDSAQDLDDNQAPNFTLATLTFDILAAGVSPLTIENLILADAGGDPLVPDFINNGSITVTSGQAPVPEPATILLLASGLFGMGVFGRKKFKQ